MQPSKIIRHLAAAALGSSLAATAAADGNVSAYVDASGDLWMIGDALDNGVSVESGGSDTDTFRIGGLDGTTTINGLPAVTLVAPGTRMILVLGDGHNRAWLGTDYGSNPSCCNRSLVVVGGAGRDELSMSGPFSDMTADLGPGDDYIVGGEGGGGVRGTLLMGDGDDEIDVGSFAGLSGYADMGRGNDRIEVARRSGMSGTFRLGDGDDVVELDRLSIADFDLDGGDGNDVLEIEGLERGSLSLSTGRGQDRVRLVSDTTSSYSTPLDPVTLDLGENDDVLELGGALGVARLDGGAGEDVFRELERVEWVAGPPDVRAFELPKGSSGPAVRIPTRIAGRVVAELGAPVAGAAVLLPELGLLTTTDAGGVFEFEPVLEEERTLELTVGATVNGRARSGAALVELRLYQTSDAGDVLLETGLRNVLVYGAPPDGYGSRPDVLEANLARLGFRPAEVTRLAALPRDLSPYGSIWHTGRIIPPLERQRLVDFVRSGRGLHLTGTVPGVSASLEPIVDQLVGAGRIDVGAPGDYHGQLRFNPDAAGGVTRVPNVLTRFDISIEHYVQGPTGRNVLLSLDTGSILGAVWDASDLAGGRGRLTLLMNSDWVGPGQRLDVLQNLQAFLLRESEGLPGR
jgi:hypothetical protein